MKYLHIIKNLCCFGLVLALPIGIYIDDPDSVDYQIGVHAGGGQLASVLTSCSEPVAAVGSSFQDVSAEAFMKLPPGKRTPFVLGVRGGYWHSNLSLINEGSYYMNGEYGTTKHEFKVGYLNPCISFESPYAGIGIGYVLGDMPIDFSEGDVNYGGHVSFHVRFGTVRGFSVSYSQLENSPFASGGGYYSAIVAVPLGDYVRSGIGISSGPYYRTGILQQNRIRINDHLGIDFSWRFGSAKDVEQYGISAGVVYQFGKFGGRKVSHEESDEPEF